MHWSIEIQLLWKTLKKTGSIYAPINDCGKKRFKKMALSNLWRMGLFIILSWTLEIIFHQNIPLWKKSQSSLHRFKVAFILTEQSEAAANAWLTNECQHHCHTDPRLCNVFVQKLRSWGVVDHIRSNLKIGVGILGTPDVVVIFCRSAVAIKYHIFWKRQPRHAM